MPFKSLSERGIISKSTKRKLPVMDKQMKRAAKKKIDEAVNPVIGTVVEPLDGHLVRAIIHSNGMAGAEYAFRDAALILEIKRLKRDNRKLKESLKSISAAICHHVAALDIEMEKPSTFNRGRRIAALRNNLELQNDSFLHSILGYSFPKIARIKAHHDTVCRQADKTKG